METHGVFASRHFKNIQKIHYNNRYTLYRAYHTQSGWTCIRSPEISHIHNAVRQANILEITHGIHGIETSIPEVMRHLSPNLVTHWAEGTPSAHLFCLPPIPMKQRLQWILAISQSLQQIHSMGILHGDIQHNNILINSHMPTLIDFELAFHLNESPCYNFAGTCSYMSPEVRLGKQYNTQSEQYAFALVCYEWITWIMCFGHPNIDILPSETQRVFFRALNRNPAQRFPSIALFAQSLIRSL